MVYYVGSSVVNSGWAAGLSSSIAYSLALLARRWPLCSWFVTQASWGGWHGDMLPDSWRRPEGLALAGMLRVRTTLGVSLPLTLRLYELGKLLYPFPTLSSLKNRLLIMASALDSHREINAWYEIADNPMLVAARRTAPETDGLLYWPYIHKDWTRGRRLGVVDRHYRLVAGRAALLARCIHRETELVRLDEDFPGLRLALDRPTWFMREGEVVLNLFLADQRLYSLAFTLGIENGECVAYVGALQGSNHEQALETYRQMTHTFHGLRPRDLLLAGSKYLCASMGVAMIWAVRGDCRQHNSAFYDESKNEQILADYDEIWLEHGGRDLGNGFHAIEPVVRQREMSEIPSKKRATYRRRYEFLDKLASRIDAAVQAGATTVASATP